VKFQLVRTAINVNRFTFGGCASKEHFIRPHPIASECGEASVRVRRFTLRLDDRFGDNDCVATSGIPHRQRDCASAKAAPAQVRFIRVPALYQYQ